MYIAQFNGYKIMTPSAFRFVPSKVCFHGAKSPWNMKADPVRLSIGYYVSIVDYMNELTHVASRVGDAARPARRKTETIQLSLRPKEKKSFTL